MEKIQNNFKKCDICGEQASSLCFNCIMYLCDSCFKLIHDKEQNKNHSKEKIDYFAPIDLKCPEHPKIPMSLFCLNDMRKYLFIKFI